MAYFHKIELNIYLTDPNLKSLRKRKEIPFLMLHFHFTLMFPSSLCSCSNEMNSLESRVKRERSQKERNFSDQSRLVFMMESFSKQS